VIGKAHQQVDANNFEEFFPELAGKSWIPVTDNYLRNSM